MNATFEALNRIQKIVSLKGIKLKSIVDVEREEAKKLQELQEKAKAAHAHKEKEVQQPVAQKAKAPVTKKPKVIKKK